MKINLSKLIVIFLIFNSGFSFAAGEIEYLSGRVSVINAKGDLRSPNLHERVEEGDTLITSRDGEIHVLTDDSGFIALRPNTQLKINSYRVDGGESDTVVLNLLRGSFRSITGWISKTHRDGYKIQTATATIGIRGTDHEPLVIDDGENAGTYDKVNTGGTSLETPFGRVEIGEKQAGFVPKSATEPPKLLAKIPEIYQPSANEETINKRKDEVEKAQDESLKLKQQDNVRKGGSPTGKPKLGDVEDQRKAGAALEELMRHYETGDIEFIRNKLDPSMIGYQKLVDDMVKETNECKQMRVRLVDTQIQAGPDLAVIQTGWEKRCLLLPNFTKRFNTGSSTFLMHRTKSGWGMAALSGSNLFVGSTSPDASKTLATLTVTNTGATCSVVNALSTSAVSLPFTITLTDPDLSTATSANVTLTTAQGEFETITLPATANGIFSKTALNFMRNSPTANNGNVDILPSIAAALVCPAITVSYTDSSTPSGTPQTVTKTVAVP